MAKYELVMDVIAADKFFGDGNFDTITINGKNDSNENNYKKLKDLGLLDEKDNFWIKAYTPIIECNLNGPAGGNPNITFDINGIKINCDLCLYDRENEDGVIELYY